MQISHEEFHRLAELERDLTKKEQRKFDNHLEKCEECFSWFENVHLPKEEEQLVEVILQSRGFPPREQRIKNIITHLRKAGLLL
jgi:predicted anti-sigma-YlaC factor YlaD